MLLDLAHVLNAAVGRRVAAIGEAVHADILHAFLLRHLQQRVKMRELRVDAALAREPQQMQAPRARVMHGGEQQDRIAKEIARLDHQVDPHHVHQQHPPRADVQVADFAVAHLAIRQSDEAAGGMDQRVRIFAQQFVVGGFARGGDGVALDGRGEAPAIEDGQDQGLRSRH